MLVTRPRETASELVSLLAELGAEVVVATPGRAMDLMGRRSLRLDDLTLVWDLDPARGGLSKKPCLPSHSHNVATANGNPVAT